MTRKTEAGRNHFGVIAKMVVSSPNRKERHYGKYLYLRPASE